MVIETNATLSEDFLRAERAFQSALARAQEQIRQEHFTFKPGHTNAHSLNVSQLDVLHAILVSPGKKNQNEVASNIGLNKGAFSRLAEKLSESGYVTITLDSNADKQTRFIELTEKGLEVARLYKTELDKTLKSLSRSPEAITLAQIINKVTP